MKGRTTTRPIRPGMPARASPVPWSSRPGKRGSRACCLVRSAAKPQILTQQLPTNVGLLEKIHELSIAPRDLGESLLPRRLLGPPGDQRVPEIGAADREADEARHLRRDLEPLPHFPVVLAAAENDAADLVAAARPRRRHDRLAILAAIETFDFPQIRIDAGVLELADGLDHQAGPELQIIGFPVALELVELRLLRRHEQLEHEATAVRGGEKIGQALQSGGLPLAV